MGLQESIDVRLRHILDRKVTDATRERDRLVGDRRTLTEVKFVETHYQRITRPARGTRLVPLSCAVEGCRGLNVEVMSLRETRKKRRFFGLMGLAAFLAGILVPYGLYRANAAGLLVLCFVPSLMMFVAGVMMMWDGLSRKGINLPVSERKRAALERNKHTFTVR